MSGAEKKACSTCGLDHPASARYCMECGAALSQTCRACGAGASNHAKFCTECGEPLAHRAKPVELEQAPPSPASPHARTPRHLAERVLRERDTIQGERKSVTVLFADIKGSTSLIEHQDPEEARQILEPVLRGMIDAVHRFDGVVSKVMGDGLMALFGAPLALEDHAVRACYAALAMRDSVRDRAVELRNERGMELQVRIGLNSGEVVVLAVGTDLHMDYDAVGATVHLAARMEQMAPADGVRLTASTVELAGDSISVDALGPVPVAGFSEPMPIFELLGSAEPELRTEASTPFSPLVGRAGEMELLRSAAQRVIKGKGQTVIVTGEPGIGKSRLSLELVRQLRAEGWLCLRSRSAPHETDQPWLAIRHMLRAHFGPVSDDGVAHRAREQICGCDPALATAVPALFELMGVDVKESNWRALKPSERRQQLVDACRGWLMAESRVRPVLIAADDMQWADTESESLLRSLADLHSTAPILLVLSSRTDVVGLGAGTHIRLQPLEPTESAQLFGQMTGHIDLANDARHRLVARAGGNPLYLTTIAHALNDTGQLAAETLPPTVQAIIAARIDALPAREKGLLQAASVLGFEFELAHLAQTIGLEEDDARAVLGGLQARGFVQERRIFPEASFGFDQPLILEVAYRGLLREKRREFHRRAFVALLQSKGDNCATSLGGLAQHSFEAGLWGEAARFCRLAAHRAAALSAYREAASLYRNALAAAGNTQDGPERTRQQIDLRIELRHVLFPTGNFDEIGGLLAAAHEASTGLGDKSRLGTVLMYEMIHHLGAGRPGQAVGAGIEALALADELGIPGTRRDVLFHLVQANASRGHYSEAIEFGERLLKSACEGPAGVTTSSMARMWLAWCSSEIGAFHEAHTHADAAFLLCRETDQLLPMLLAHLGRGLVHLREERFDEAAVWLEAALPFSDQASLRAWWGALGSPLGRAWLGLGRVDDAIGLLEKVVAHSASSRGSGHALRSVHLGEAYCAAGRHEEAARLARDANELARAHGERGHEAYSCLLLAELAYADGRREDALANGEAAKRICIELQMGPLQSRVARLLRCAAAFEGFRDGEAGPLLSQRS